MASGFFLGGLSEGFQRQEALNNQQNYQQGLLQIEQQRLQQQQQNEKRNEYMKLRSQAIADMQNTVTAVKNAHPDWTDAQVLSFPALVSQRDQLSGFDKNLGLDPNSAGSILAGMATGKSQIQTEGAIARAKEGPQHQALVQSEINRNNAISGVDLNNPDRPGTGANGPAMGQKTAQSTQTDATGQSAEEALKNKYDTKTLFKAGQLLAGNTSVLSGLGYGRQGAAARKQIQDAAADMAIARGMTPEQVNSEVANFMGQKRAATQAGMRVGNVTVAMDAAQAASTRVISASDKVNRTQYPTINSVILAAQQGTGDENVVQYGIAVNTLVNNYARAIGGGNQQLTDSARQEAIANLNVAWSKGQIRAAVDQINKEIASELSGAKKAMKDVTSGAKEDPLGIR